MLKNYNTEKLHLIKNTLWLGSERIARILIVLVVGLWLARYLGPEKFGLLNYATTIIALVSPISSLSLNTIVVKKIILNQEKTTIIVTNATIIQLIATAIVILIINIYVYSSEYFESEKYIVIAICSASALFHIYFPIKYYYESQINSKIVAKTEIISLILISTVKVFLIIYGYDVYAFAICNVIESAIIFIILSIYFYKKIFDNNNFNIDKKLILSMLNEAFPLIISGLAIIIYMKIDQIMLASMVDIKSVGIYTAALRISEAWYLIPTIICTTMLPKLIELNNFNNGKYFRVLEKQFTVLITFSLVIIFAVSQFSKLIIHTLYGEQYDQSIDVLNVHIWTNLFVFIGLLSGRCYIIHNLHKIMLLQTAIGAFINVILNLFLIPKYGITGAAWASLISQMITNIGLDPLFKETKFLYNIKIQAFIKVINLIPTAVRYAKKDKNGR